MFITKDQTQSYIRRLESLNKKSSRKKKNLLILEPRMFKILFKELPMDSVMELNRVSNSCEQICNEMNIKYESNSTGFPPEDYVGNFICGYTAPQVALMTVEQVLPKLKPGYFFAIWHKYSFLETKVRVNKIFKVNPFDEMLLTASRPAVSSDGYFDSYNNTRSPYNGAWFIWHGDTNGQMKTPTIRWVDDLMEEYYKHDANGNQVVMPYAMGGYKIFSKPIEIELDSCNNS